MTYDPYEAKEAKDAKDAGNTGAAGAAGDTGHKRDTDRLTTAGEVERALRSERGSKPATPVVPLSESDPATVGGVGHDAGRRPARPTTPPPVAPPAAPPVTPPGTAPATPPEPAHRSAPATARQPEKDLSAAPAHDPVRPVEARDTAKDSAPARETVPGRTPESAPAQTPRLIPQEECDKLNLRLQEALSTFVDGPRRSVEEAADVLEETAKRLTTALNERPRHLRDSWDADGGRNGKPTADTEDLRLALRSYREVTERLLRI